MAQLLNFFRFESFQIWKFTWTERTSNLAKMNNAVNSFIILLIFLINVLSGALVDEDYVVDFDNEIG